MEEAVASINEADFLQKIGVIAHDSMMGRANPSPGLDMTAQWIADEFKSYGLEPGGDDGTLSRTTISGSGHGLRCLFRQVTGGPDPGVRNRSEFHAGCGWW